MPRTAYAVLSHGWRRLHGSLSRWLGENPGSAPHLGDLAADLERLIEATHRRKLRLKMLEGEVRYEARLLREDLARGKAIESRLRSALKAIFGPTSPLLIPFGIEPLRGPRHPPPPAEAAPAPAPPPSPVTADPEVETSGG
jgi:hypothetical protein